MTRSQTICPNCAGSLVEIKLGEDLTMQSCSRCERRSWLRGGQAADLRQALDVVARSGKRKVAV